MMKNWLLCLLCFYYSLIACAEDFNSKEKASFTNGLAKIIRISKQKKILQRGVSDEYMDIVPSFNNCSSSTWYYNSLDSWMFGCADCTMRFELLHGSIDGGHNDTFSNPTLHNSSTRPLGQLNLPQNTNIPVTGWINVGFQAPNQSGEIIMRVHIDHTSTTIPDEDHDIHWLVYVPDLVPVEASGYLDFDVASHSYGGVKNGHYLTADARDFLYYSIAAFRGAVIDDLAETPVTLESEGATLEYGGVFDINKNWGTPHCYHRDGYDIDLSLSVFSGQADQLEKFELALIANGYIFPYEGERPGDIGATHWHGYFSW